MCHVSVSDPEQTFCHAHSLCSVFFCFIRTRVGSVFDGIPKTDRYIWNADPGPDPISQNQQQLVKVTSWLCFFKSAVINFFFKFQSTSLTNSLDPDPFLD